MPDVNRRIASGWLLVAVLSASLAACRQPAPSAPKTAQDSYRRPQLLVAALALRTGDHVAEIGAGGGYLTRYLATAVGPAGRIVATDIDDGALAALADRVRQERLDQVLPRRVTTEDPGLESAAYDLILMAQVDHLLADRSAYLRRLVPALRPGSRSRIAVSNRESHRAELLTAAVAAGLHIEPAQPAPDLPGQYLLFLRP